MQMRQKKFKLSTLLLLSIGLTGLKAQESINTSGIEVSSNGGSVSYSIGQMVYNSNAEANFSLTQGVQQPYEIMTVTGIEDTKGINLWATAYPNPTSDYLTLSIEESDISNISYQLYDMNGRLLQNAKITGNQTSIVMNNLIPAIYFVKIIQNWKEIKTFKIIKN